MNQIFDDPWIDGYIKKLEKKAEELEQENEKMEDENKRLEGEVRHMEEASENSWIEYCRIGDENKQLEGELKQSNKRNARLIKRGEQRVDDIKKLGEENEGLKSQILSLASVAQADKPV